MNQDTDFIGIDIPRRTVHFFQSVAAMRASLVFSPGEVREYFDGDRFRLTPAFDDEGRVARMVRTTSRLSERSMQARLNAVVRNSRQRIDGEFAAGVRDDDHQKALQEALSGLDAFDGASFAERYVLLAQSVFSDPEEDHDSGAIHNCLAHGRCW
ncbi:hypothetical protein [Actinoplanes sp. NPDC023714]|uniref:hypothetical protein n=1 Tax=Actinoplanes sp. NPDC023714 TaxID=3154322 RepID=UPI0033FABF14